MTVSDHVEQPCHKSDNAIKLVTSLEQIMRTQPVVSYEQTCNNFVCRPVTTRVFIVSIYFTRNN